jgi:hypothetical protein
MADNINTMTVEEEANAVDVTYTDSPMYNTSNMAAEDFVVEETACAEDFVMEDAAKTLPGSTMTVEDEPEQDAKDTNWADDKDHSKFMPYFEGKFHTVPKHSGNTIPGCERAHSYCKDMQGELSKAMRSDLEGKIDEGWADEKYRQLNDHIERLEKQIKKLQTNTSTKNRVFASPEVRLVAEGKCDRCEGDVPTWHDVENDRVVCLKCNAVVGSDGLEKIANTPVINVMITPFQRAFIATLINGACSGGKNIEELWEKMEKKYKLDDKERLGLIQLLADYGYPLILDRAKIDENDGENNGELNRNYPA